MAAVSLRKVSKSYGAVQVIREVDLDIPDHAFAVLVGPSGCGKSTLLKLIAGLDDLTTGEIAIGGRVVNDRSPADRDIAMVFQSYALYPHMTVADNLGFHLKIARMPRQERDTRIAKVAENLGIAQFLNRFPRDLSGGQRQRVAMGRAIVRDPKVFLFDEPLSNLDAKLRVAMRAEIKALHQRLKTTTVYVTHDQIEAMTMADRIVVMHDGIIEQIGTPLELFDRPGNLFVAQFIGSPAMNVLKGRLRHGEGRHWVEAQGLRWPVRPVAAGADAQPVHYGIRPSDISLSESGQGIEARVIVVEPTGADTELLLQVGEEKLVVVLHGRTEARPEDIVKLAIDPARAHVFDDADGQRLSSAP